MPLVLAGFVFLSVVVGALSIAFFRSGPDQAAQDAAERSRQAQREGALARHEERRSDGSRRGVRGEPHAEEASGSDAGAAESEHDEDLARLYAPIEPAHENLDESEASAADLRLQEERRALRAGMLRAGIRPEHAVYSERD